MKMISGSCLDALRNGDCLTCDGVLDGDGSSATEKTTTAADLPGLGKLLTLHLVGKYLAILTAGGLLNGHHKLASSLNLLFATRAGESFLAAPKGVLDTKRPPSPTVLRVFLAPGRRISITVNERSVLSISLYSTWTLFFNIMPGEFANGLLDIGEVGRVGDGEGCFRNADGARLG